MKFNILKSEFSLLTRYYLTRGFIALTRAFNLLTRAFNLPTRAFDLVTCAFSLLTRGFELVTRKLKLVTRGFELVTREIKLLNRGFELATRVLLLHIKFMKVFRCFLKLQFLENLKLTHNFRGKATLFNLKQGMFCEQKSHIFSCKQTKSSKL